MADNDKSRHEKPHGSRGSGSHKSTSHGYRSGKPTGRGSRGFKPRNNGRGRSYDPRDDKPTEHGAGGRGAGEHGTGERGAGEHGTGGRGAGEHGHRGGSHETGKRYDKSGGAHKSSKPRRYGGSRQRDEPHNTGRENRTDGQRKSSGSFHSGRPNQSQARHGSDKSQDYHRGERQEGHRDVEHTGHRPGSEDGPRRNSDGTISFPSQNPYTDRRPGEPKMPKGLEWSMLSRDERERLRGLSKEHAENIGLHILAAFALEEDDPQAALEHATWVAKQASRVDFARETLAFIAYRQGDYRLALREFRTAYRMNGFADYLPFIADCERGIGEAKKAMEVALSDDAKRVTGEAKAELFLVYAGALADLGQWDKAINVVHQLGRSKGLDGPYRMRAIQAEQFFLEGADRHDDAAALDELLDKLEEQYAEMDDDETSDVVIDYDLEHLPDDMIESMGIGQHLGEASNGHVGTVAEAETAEAEGHGTADSEADSTADFTVEPTAEQSVDPTAEQTVDPTVQQSVDPTVEQTVDPTTKQTVDPATEQTVNPTVQQSVDSSTKQTVKPTAEQSHDPSADEAKR